MPTQLITMPIMDSVSCYFDCRYGMTSMAWENQVGDADIQLYSPTITDDGVQFDGTETSYGILTYGGESGESVTGEYTRYVVLKKTDDVYSNWRTIIGNESGNTYCSTIAISETGNYKFTRRNIITSVSCTDFHVIAWRKSGSYTYLYIDGVYMGSASGADGLAADTYFGRGPTWWYGNNHILVRFFCVADSAHSADDIITNSQFLMSEFIDHYDKDGRGSGLSWIGSTHTQSAWVDSLRGTQIALKSGEWEWNNKGLVLDGSSAFSFQHEFGSYGTYEVCVDIDRTFVPENTTDWYLCSCILGQEIGGIQRDFGILIDRDGKFAIGYGSAMVYSSSINALDGNLHTIAYDIGPKTLKFYIDGTLINTISYSSTGTQMTEIGVGWNASGQFTAIEGAIYAVRYNRKSLTQAQILANYQSDVAYVKLTKYLMKSGNTFYTVVNNVVTAIQGTTATAQMFRDSGMDSLPSSAHITTLSDPSVLCWIENTDYDPPNLTMTVSYLPSNKPVVTSAFEVGLDYIASATSTATSDILFSISFDNGTTWKYYDGTEWTNSSSVTEGMTKETLEALTATEWVLVGSDNNYKLRFVFPGVDSTFTSIIVNYENEETEGE